MILVAGIKPDSSAVLLKVFAGVIVEAGTETPNIDISDGVIRFRNVSAAFQQGMEFSLSSNPFWRLEIVTLYTYIDSGDKVLRVPLTYRHKHIFALYPSIKLADIKLTMEYRYKSRVDRVAIFQENPITGQDKRIPIKLIDVRVEVPISIGHIRFTIANLTNYHYTEIERSMRPGRSFVISFSTIINHTKTP